MYLHVLVSGPLDSCLCVGVGACMDGWTDGWMDGWMDGRMDVCMFVCRYSCMCMLVSAWICVYDVWCVGRDGGREGGVSRSTGTKVGMYAGTCRVKAAVRN